jgi:hypothetical protein
MKENIIFGMIFINCYVNIVVSCNSIFSKLSIFSMVNIYSFVTF